MYVYYFLIKVNTLEYVSAKPLSWVSGFFRVSPRLTVHVSSQTANKTQKFAAHVCSIPCSKAPESQERGTVGSLGIEAIQNG